MEGKRRKETGRGIRKGHEKGKRSDDVRKEGIIARNQAVAARQFQPL